MDRSRQTCREWRTGAVLCIALTAVLAGCTMGPNFTRPAPPKVQSYTSAPAPAAITPGNGEPEQHLAVGRAVSARWWTLFKSPRLNAVINLAVTGNPNLAAARATLAQARQAVLQVRGELYPQLDASAAVQRQQSAASRNPGSSAFFPTSRTTNLYSLGPSVSYAADVFGGIRRRVEQQQALADNQGYQLGAAYLTLTGNVVSQAIAIASVRQQMVAVQEIVADDRKNLRLVKLKYEAGKAAYLDVLTAQSQLANDLTLLPPLRNQLSGARHALSVLVGRLPGTWSAPKFNLADFTLPPHLPLSIPSKLVHQRPDILAAEAQLHASSAAIGIASAQMYPSITLSASAGLESLSGAALFSGSSEVWKMAAGLTAPIFHGGALRAQKQAAIDAFHASAATYRQTVLSAFGQVADVLRALAHDAELVRAEKHALDASLASTRLQRLSYSAGKSDLLQLLYAERSYQQARLGYTRAVAQRFQDTDQLFVAMGGGWWNAPHLGLAQPGG